jgi:hypothetical protein
VRQTVDRYLNPERARLRLKGISTTKLGTLLRNSIKIAGWRRV